MFALGINLKQNKTKPLILIPFSLRGEKNCFKQIGWYGRRRLAW